MNPYAPVHYPTSNDAELDRLQALCTQLEGFEPGISVEWLDGALTALAAGPRQHALPLWRERLVGEAWSRAYADPVADREAAAVVQARWNVLARQLDPQILLDQLDELRLAPVLLDWSDDPAAPEETDAVDDAAAAAVPDDRTEALPRSGELWAIGFMETVQAFPEDWPESLTTEGDLSEAFLDALERISLLAVREPPVFQEMVLRLHPDGVPDREQLVEDAMWAVQDLRALFVEQAPRPETRRVAPQPGRNDPCPCGSGLKFKKCHGR